MNTCMRVVFLLTFLDSQTGGMERQALQLAVRLRERGHDIFFITCAQIGGMRRNGLRFRDTFHGFRIYRIPLVAGWRRWNAIAYGVGALFLLTVLQRHYTLIHAHQVHTSGTIAMIAGYFLRSKRVMVKNCCGGSFGDITNWERLLPSARIRRFLQRRVDMAIGVSEETVAEMAHAGFSPIRCIPNGVDTDRYHPHLGSRHAMKAALHPDMSEKQWILFVGKLDPQKNVSILFSALEQLSDDLVLLIVGDGALRATLEADVRARALSHHVIFCGAVPETLPYYRAADVFVLPSFAEGLSNALLEAMSVGVPCIGSDIAGIRAVITDGATGVLVPPQDADAIAAAIRDLCAHPRDAETLGERARARISAEYGLAGVAERYATLYESLIEHP